MLLVDERFGLEDTHGTAIDLAGRVAGREVCEEFAAIVVKAAAATDDKF